MRTRFRHAALRTEGFTEKAPGNSNPARISLKKMELDKISLESIALNSS